MYRHWGPGWAGKAMNTHLPHSQPCKQSHKMDIHLLASGNLLQRFRSKNTSVYGELMKLQILALSV